MCKIKSIYYGLWSKIVQYNRSGCLIELIHVIQFRTSENLRIHLKF